MVAIKCIAKKALEGKEGSMENEIAVLHKCVEQILSLLWVNPALTCPTPLLSLLWANHLTSHCPISFFFEVDIKIRVILLYGYQGDQKF